MARHVAEHALDRDISAIRSEYLKLEGRGVPKSACVAEALLRVLEKGHLGAGDRLPTEAILTEALPVSLGTVQSALRELVNIGAITRKRRDGTRFAEVFNPRTRNWHFQFFSEELDRFLIPRGHVHELTKTRTCGPWKDFLVPRGECLKISRELDMEGHFAVQNDFYIDAKKFGRLAEIPVEQWEDTNLRQVLHEYFNAPTLRVTQWLDFQSTDDIVELELTVRAVTLRDKPLFFQRFRIPPNDFTLRLVDWDQQTHN